MVLLWSWTNKLLLEVDVAGDANKLPGDKRIPPYRSSSQRSIYMGSFEV